MDFKNLLTPETISAVLAALGVLTFVSYRASLIKKALETLIDAAEDGSVSEAEFQAIVKAAKAIFGKKA